MMKYACVRTFENNFSGFISSKDFFHPHVGFNHASMWEQKTCSTAGTSQVFFLYVGQCVCRIERDSVAT